MSKRAVLGEMSLCYVKISSSSIGDIVGNSKAKIICVNDTKVLDESKAKDEDDNEDCSKKQNIYNQLHEALTSKYGQKSRFENT